MGGLGHRESEVGPAGLGEKLPLPANLAMGKNCASLLDNAPNYLVGCVIQKRLNSDQTLTYALQPFLSINDVYQSFGGYQSSVRGEMVMIWMCIMKLSGTLKSNICKCGFFKILFLFFTMFFFGM